MKVDFVLVATGNIILPRIHHAIMDISNDPEVAKDRAIQEAEKLIAVLTKAGYFSFTLYDVAKEDHVPIATFRVDVPEPIVTTLRK